MRSKHFIPAFLVASFFLAGCVSAGERVCLREACYTVDVVRSEEDRARGLMYREELGQGKGMLFVFGSEGVYPFWMKNMLFAIDIIWLDRDKRVVHVVSNAMPCNVTPCPLYTPSASALYVLEVPAGDAARYGIQPGDILR